MRYIWAVTSPSEKPPFCYKIVKCTHNWFFFPPSFLPDRQPVRTHLPLAYTHSLPEDEEKLMEVLEEFSQKFKSVSPGV